ncbi:pentatricopeptide repeat-containing protein chloroplastic [Dorcoceras hygrometricum]|uniref:Pentatricopeptide repeat-containing protein chloroplastic n=1 Tax=Dorcoceras hygrometricum TaxID=472368 RepID=A0A2Z6ZXD3_9LAMI|nr:pentatricopeptide repeat-containing protein chloroplastic [Dorcoceras hygrometricum]
MSTAELNSNGESDKKPAKEKDTISHTVAAVVHLRSLGVLTAAGCGIGSVHAVVRSNLLVEPSEEEEGEM